MASREATETPLDDRFPALRTRRRTTIEPNVDLARRVLWRAFQRGALTDNEFASTLDRLDFEGGARSNS